MNLREFFLFVAFDIEGFGYDKNDLGGKTIYGVTKRNYPQFYNRIKDAYEKADENLLHTAIIESYQEIWNESFANKLPEKLGMFHFDFYFNAGHHALKNLQAILKHLGYYRYKIDGIFGKLSLKGLDNFISNINNLPNYTLNEIIELYNWNRRRFYLENPQEEYCKGWVNRVQKVEHKILFNGNIERC